MRSEPRNRELSGESSADRPSYDRERRELRLGGKLVKRFTQRAPHQHLILSTFEEQKWPSRIDNPLFPDAYAEDRKLRLNRVIYRLNRRQRNRLIHFRGDGSGDGVIWELWPSEPGSG